MLGEPRKSLNVHALLAQGMGPSLHWFPEDVTTSRLAAALVGMANASGGMVVIGVTPRAGRVLGVIDPESVVDRIFQASTLTEPVLVLPVPTLHEAGRKNVLIVTVPSGLPHVYNLEGRYLGRDGRYTSPLSARKLRQLLHERGVVQFESRIPPESTLDDLDMEQVEAYLETFRVTGEDDWRSLLTRRGCLLKEGKRIRPTYAALLLFGKHPQQWLPNASILATRFPGSTFSDEFLKQDIRGTLPQQLRMVEHFLRDNLRTVVRVVGLVHKESLEYPLEAVRELIVNAVAHRDYNIQGDDIHLNIFSDRLEIHSPGCLPGPVNLKNLLNARFSRNAVIVQVLADLGFVERLGYGLNRVVTVMRRHGLRAPHFHEVAGTFRVMLIGEPFPTRQTPNLAAFSNLELNNRQRLALGYLATNKRINNKIYQELCPDVHPETLRRDLADLVKRNVLLKIGDKRSTYYILK
jgi:ATP-dependent DNA helicase RecG